MTLIPGGCRCVYVITVAGDVTTLSQRIAHPLCAATHDSTPVAPYPPWVAPLVGEGYAFATVDATPIAPAFFRTGIAAAAAQTSPMYVNQIPAAAHIGERYQLPNGITVEVIARPII